MKEKCDNAECIKICKTSPPWNWKGNPYRRRDPQYILNLYIKVIVLKKKNLQSNKKKTDNPIESWLKNGKPLHKRKSRNDQYVWICERVIDITSHQGNAVGIHALAGKKITTGRDHDGSFQGAGVLRLVICEIWSYFMLMTYKLLHVYYTSKKIIVKCQIANI